MGTVVAIADYLKEKEEEMAKLPARKREMPATVGYVEEVRDELKAEIRALSHKMDAGFAAVDGKLNALEGKFNNRFSKIDERFSKIDERFNKIDERFSKMEALIQETNAMIHRSLALWEEQRSENRIVLEKMAALEQEDKVLAARQDKFDAFMREAAKRAKPPIGI